jgi:hypothetical protein
MSRAPARAVDHRGSLIPYCLRLLEFTMVFFGLWEVKGKIDAFTRNNIPPAISAGENGDGGNLD